MKKILIALIALVSISVSANAQTTPARVRQHDKVERKRENDCKRINAFKK